MYDLSVIIPARNEMFLSKTIEDVLANKEGNTEVIAILDGEWVTPEINDHPDLTLIHHSKPVGQRSAQNQGARLSQAKYLMKLDGHCSVDKGFDVKMMAEMQPDWTMIPVMRNLHAFDWVCPDGHRRYQSPSGVCTTCGKETKREIMWIAKTNPQSTAYYFDNTLHFQYHQGYKTYQHGDIVETMSAQGSCFMLTRDKYFELNICDETWGSWGNQGTEVALKTWLSGGRLVVNKKTWYAHMFRTQGGDFSFPYPMKESDVEKARQKSREIFLNDKWDKAKRPLSWLIDKFEPPTWQLRKKTKGIIYYTDNQADQMILDACQDQIKACAGDMPIVSVSLKPIVFGKNIVLNLERGRETYFKQILTALENIDTDIVFFCEHDVLYHPSHFEFTPDNKELFYYNDNKWKVDFETGQALFYHCNQVSGLCGFRELLLEHYRWRVALNEKEGFTRKGYEPGTRTKQFAVWNSKFPNIDIRHKNTLTANRWSQDQFRDKSTCQGWVMADEVPFWGKTKGRFKELLNEL